MLPNVNFEYLINGIGYAGSVYLSNMECWFSQNRGNLTPEQWDKLIKTAYSRYDVYWQTSDDVGFCQNQRFIQKIFDYFNDKFEGVR